MRHTQLFYIGVGGRLDSSQRLVACGQRPRAVAQDTAPQGGGFLCRKRVRYLHLRMVAMMRYLHLRMAGSRKGFEGLFRKEYLEPGGHFIPRREHGHGAPAPAIPVAPPPAPATVTWSTTGSYLRLIDSCITQLKAQGPSRTCNESKEEAAQDAP